MKADTLKMKLRKRVIGVMKRMMIDIIVFVLPCCINMVLGFYFQDVCIEGAES